MKDPILWKKQELHHHLQHALNLELWTIPLYLTALYSIKDLKKLKPHDYPDAAKLLLSVVAQEMLHLELVCNISNALGNAPVFNAPVYDEQKGIPFIHPAKDYIPEILKGYAVKPQALNQHSLKLFCAIELPHPKKENAWEAEHMYDSIAELYEALKHGIINLWDECYVGDEFNTKQKESFKEYHNSQGRHHGFSQHVHSRETALKAIHCIIEQGEGADSNTVPADYRPPNPEEGKEYDAGWYRGQLSHFQKFRILLHHHHKLPPVHEEKSGETYSTAQHEMENAFADFLKELENNFNSNGSEMNDDFWKKMFGLGDAIVAVWESGQCPQF